jgi:zinc transport system substrate-binding protein
MGQGQTALVSGETEKVKVIASFFPLYDFARNIGTDKIDVSIMVPPGVEPHDWDPTPKNIADVEGADLVVYNGAGFEGWVSKVNAKEVVDTSTGIDLIQGEGHEGEEDEGVAFDPHIWLDPMFAKKQVESIRDGLVRVDSANAGHYMQNAELYMAELDSLDSFISLQLSDCEKSDFIAFHDAFSYFAKRYGLKQHSVQGLSPQGEVLPQRLLEIKELATELGIDVIYSEDLIDPRLANVIADEIQNGRVLVLSPVEGLTKEEQDGGFGYIEKMRQNVENLKVGLKCQP